MELSEKKTKIFAEMPVQRAVLIQAIPAIVSQMIWLVYNLADIFFVGLLNDPVETAAVTVGGATFIMLTAISNLLGVGGASTIAAALGRKETDKARQISSFCFWACCVCAVAWSVIFFVFVHPILSISGATEDTFAVTFSYVKWSVILGGPFTILSMMLGNLVRSEGSAFAASFGLSMGGILNIFLDPLFILPRFLGFGAQGAGIATGISNCVTMLFFLGYLVIRRKNTILSLSPRLVPQGWKQAKQVLSIGLPAALQNALTTVSVSAVLFFLSKYTTEAVAAYGIVQKWSFVPLYFTMGLANGILPLLAYNHAAGNHKRRSRIFRFGILLSEGFAIVCLIAYELFPAPLCSVFISDPTTITLAAAFMRRMVVAVPFMAICYPMISQFQAMGRAVEALVASIIRKGTLDIPFLFLMNWLVPLYGPVWVWPIVDAISLVIILILYRRVQRILRVKT